MYFEDISSDQFQMEATETGRFIGTDHQDDIVVDALVALTPNCYSVFGYIDVTVMHLIVGDCTLGEERSLQFGRKITGSVTFKENQKVSSELLS